MAQKSNPWTITEREVRRAEIEGFMTEAKGTVQLIVVRPEATPDLYKAAKKGDQHARCIIMSIGKLLAELEQKPKPKSPLLCMTCDRVATRKGMRAVAVLMPEEWRSETQHVIAAPICGPCLKKPYRQLQKQMLVMLKQNFGFEMIVE